MRRLGLLLMFIAGCALGAQDLMHLPGQWVDGSFVFTRSGNRIYEVVAALGKGRVPPAIPPLPKGNHRLGFLFQCRGLWHCHCFTRPEPNVTRGSLMTFVGGKWEETCAYSPAQGGDVLLYPLRNGQYLAWLGRPWTTPEGKAAHSPFALMKPTRTGLEIVREIELDCPSYYQDRPIEATVLSQVVHTEDRLFFFIPKWGYCIAFNMEQGAKVAERWIYGELDARQRACASGIPILVNVQPQWDGDLLLAARHEDILKVQENYAAQIEAHGRAILSGSPQARARQTSIQDLWETSVLRVPLIRWFRMDGRTAALRRIDEPSGGRSLLQGYRDLRQFEWVPMPDGSVQFLPPQTFKPATLPGLTRKPAESTPPTGTAPSAPSPK